MAGSKSDSKPDPKPIDKLSFRNLPGSRGHLSEIRDKGGTHILKLAETLVGSVKKELETASSKQRLQHIEDLFFRHAHVPREVPKTLEKKLGRPGHAETVAGLDNDWDQAYAEALNAFEQASGSSESKVQVAEDNWDLAIRVYESEVRSAAAVFKAKIELADAESPAKKYESDEEAVVEVDYYTRSSLISEALTEYEQAKATATSSLSSALGTLIPELFDAITITTVAQAELIQAVQDASLTFWTAANTELNTSR